MAKHYYKNRLDYAIVDILDTRDTHARYFELESSLCCRVSSSSLVRHLKRLVGGKIIDRKVEKDGHTLYALTKQFKEKLDIQKKAYPANYLAMTFSLYPFNQYEYEVSYSFHKDRLDVRPFIARKN
jgi:DNA-binding PadR family transcriptional regulator